MSIYHSSSVQLGSYVYLLTNYMIWVRTSLRPHHPSAGRILSRGVASSVRL